MIHTTNCRFCGNTVNADIADGCPIEDAKKWLPMAACDRCADFRMALLKLGDKCVWVLNRVHNAQGTKAEVGVKSFAREQLTEITKRIMRVICDHWRVTNYWDGQIVDEIMEHPDKVRFIISHMRDTVKQSARRAA